MTTLPSHLVDPARVAEVATFLDSLPPDFDRPARLEQVRGELASTGTYVQTSLELAEGMKQSWRNSVRCIGRLHWEALQVVDRRAATTAQDVFDACVEHLREGTNGGHIRPMVTVFAPQRTDGSGIRIWNSQLVRYAGYRQADGTIVGDPLNVDLTAAIEELGWRGDGGRFDILPLTIQMPGELPHWFEIPADAVLEVPIVHPEFCWFDQLDLRWNALPAISNLSAYSAGRSYSAVFSGWFVSFEIARNIGDEDRFDMLPRIAAGMGLDTRRADTLWKDRALVELTAAILWSFRQAGVRIVDHHTAARQFVRHEEREQRAGRSTPADWAWVVPPMSSSLMPTFHRSYDSTVRQPNFSGQTHAWASGDRMCPTNPSHPLRGSEDM